jgi:hypothetical protein
MGNTHKSSQIWFRSIATTMPSQKSTPKYTSTGKLDDRYAGKVCQGIKKAAAECKLQLTLTDDELSTYVHMGSATTRFGNRPIQGATPGNYEGTLRQLWKYAAMIGDYASMMMLLKTPPKHCPAMSVLLVESFVRFKLLNQDEPLLNLHGEPILDVLGKQMTCDGGWHAPKNIDSYRAALHDIHIANDHTVAYEEACPDCALLDEDDQHKGCQHHKGHPRIYRHGTPTSNIIFTNTVKEMELRAIAAGYKEKGSSQLLPSDFRLLRSRLLSTCNILDLQMWVIIICATKLGLRHDEFHELSADRFLPEHFEISDSRIDALALKVYGKCDTDWVMLKLHADHVYPDLCPVRPLLIYMHLLGIKGGFLFPTADEIKTPPVDGLYKTKVEYKIFLRQFKKLCYDVLPPRPDFKIGAQVFRKSFYCLAIFGDAPEMDLKQSARHKSFESSMVYRKAAQTLYIQHQNNPHISNNVSKWKSIQIQGGDGNTLVLLALGGCKIMQFEQLGDYFVRQLLRVGQDNPLASDTRFLINTALEYIGADSPCQQFRDFIAELHPDKAAQLQLIVDGLLNLQVKKLLQNEGLAVATVGLVLQAADDTAVQPPNKKQRVEPNDLPGREQLRHMATSIEKVAMIKKLDVDKATTPLTPGAKSFVYKHLTPIINCLAKHFGDDEMLFAEAYPHFSHTIFASTCCNGKGDTCAPAPDKNT